LSAAAPCLILPCSELFRSSMDTLTNSARLSVGVGAFGPSAHDAMNWAASSSGEYVSLEPPANVWVRKRLRTR
jgi:hypothetical protein